MKVTGTIKVIGQTEVISDKYKKRSLVIVTDEEKYPQTIEVQFSQDKCELINNYAEGELVEVDTNLRGREWTNPQGEVKYFLSLEGWRISLAGAPRAQSPAPTYQHEFKNNGPKSSIGNIESNFLEDEIRDFEEEDDLPF